MEYWLRLQEIPFNVMDLIPKNIRMMMGVNDSIPTVRNLSLLNPTAIKTKTHENQLIIEFNLEKPAPVIANLYDLSGKKLEGVINQNHSAGISRKNFSMAGYSPGIYLFEWINKISNEKQVIKIQLLN